MFHPINYQYGYCLNPSDVNHRNAYPGVDVYQNGSSVCSPNVGMAPGLYSPPTLSDIANANQKAVNQLAKSQRVMANMIAFDDKHQEQIFLIENTKLKVGDLILLKNGEQVPIDCKILWGECSVSEAIISG